MAASLPNPKDFKSWEDAFQHPLPAVRKLEQQLRSHAAENREKLRSLVGGSYRDLLGTAERICDMDETMQGIETTLGLTASKCNSGIVEKIFANAAKLNEDRSARDAQRNGMAAQLSVLRNCHNCVLQLLKQEGQLYCAAKVLVLGRLIHKMLSQQPDVPPLVDGLRKRLSSCESLLLKKIDRSFSNPAVDGQLLVSEMCAFSLATSSAPTDVLYHFLKVRLEAIRNLPSESRRARTNMTRAIKLFKTSLSASQSIFPKRLAEALGKVKLQPLLQDREIRSLAELNLEIYERWIANDVRNFTPWPRHDELQRSEAQKITTSWVPAAMEALKTSLEDILQGQDDFEDVLELRTAVIEAHVTSNDQAPGVSLSDVLDIVRGVFNKRLTDLIKTKVGGLLALVEQIKITTHDLTAASQPTRPPSLWDLADEDSSLENGSSNFKKLVRSRLHGSNEAMESFMDASAAWTSSITTARARILNMKERRWEDDILDAGNDDDDLDLDIQQAYLADEDPRALGEALDKALEATLTAFGRAVGQLIESGGQSTRAVFLVRVLRDLAQKTATLDARFDHAKLVQTLSGIIGLSVAKDDITTYEAALERLVKAHHLPAVALWEGHPALPSQPMTSTFKLLRNVTRSMAASGQDLWTPALVNNLKTNLGAKLAESLESTIKAIQATPETPATAINGVSDDNTNHEEPSTDNDEAQARQNGDSDAHSSTKASEAEVAEDQEQPAQNGDSVSTTDAVASSPAPVKPDGVDTRKLKAQQLLFDLHYLARILSPATQQGILIPFQSVSGVALELSDLPKDQYERVRKNVNDYWRKTYLLFGLLA